MRAGDQIVFVIGERVTSGKKNRVHTNSDVDVVAYLIDTLNRDDIKS